jgi:hypothetical protein
MQKFDGKLHPIRFVSRVLKQNELNYHLAKKEVLALLRVFRVCYNMLTGQKLTVLTRYSLLKWLYNHRVFVWSSFTVCCYVVPMDF